MSPRKNRACRPFRVLTGCAGNAFHRRLCLSARILNTRFGAFEKCARSSRAASEASDVVQGLAVAMATAAAGRAARLPAKSPENDSSGLQTDFYACSLSKGLQATFAGPQGVRTEALQVVLPSLNAAALADTSVLNEGSPLMAAQGAVEKLKRLQIAMVDQVRLAGSSCVAAFPGPTPVPCAYPRFCRRFQWMSAPSRAPPCTMRHSRSFGTSDPV